ncbi:hypothetical protein GQ55_9G513200 [Panicum hallii var. hallii]|uniref:Uncharacterized protein n=1 Tax=Panicum hallii var. hallii TaxID=1504633 RepID=A0A2T7CDW6_9POAL|nr:hypothetical protein GQ55_9G513200 [Panicum hallii var. hallii]
MFRSKGQNRCWGGSVGRTPLRSVCFNGWRWGTETGLYRQEVDAERSSCKLNFLAGVKFSLPLVKFYLRLVIFYMTLSFCLSSWRLSKCPMWTLPPF